MARQGDTSRFRAGPGGPIGYTGPAPEPSCRWKPRTSPTPPRRGVYLLPNLFTTGGMFAGFYAIVAAIGGRYEEAAIAVFVAGVLDGIDGRVARLTNTQSDFGVQYDSLADLVSFGLAPALVMYMWSLAALKGYWPLLGKVGWAAAFLYAACAALRLARFNTQVGSVDKRWFIGPVQPGRGRTDDVLRLGPGRSRRGWLPLGAGRRARGDRGRGPADGEPDPLLELQGRRQRRCASRSRALPDPGDDGRRVRAGGDRSAAGAAGDRRHLHGFRGR